MVETDALERKEFVFCARYVGVGEYLIFLVLSSRESRRGRAGGGGRAFLPLPEEKHMRLLLLYDPDIHSSTPRSLPPACCVCTPKGEKLENCRVVSVSHGDVSCRAV